MDVNTEFKDRKRFTYAADIYHDSLSPDVYYAATMHNFSKGGLYFESDQSLKIGDYINLRIKHPPHSSGKDNIYELGVEIIWRKNLRYSSFRYGYGAKYIDSNVSLENIIDPTELDRKRSQHNEPKEEMDPREHPRRSYNKSLFFISNNKNYEGLITNISRGGAFIETHISFSVGQIIMLVVPGHKGRKTFKLKGCIVRLNRSGVGVQFDRRKAVRNRRSDLDRRSGLDRRASRWRKDRKK
ncbi:MAG: PilZ domain-containing protein [Desulfobacterales bacterium]|jgi:Tfp pilus assembly protein PilZ